MSGPKRAQWFFVYDPTPARLADLRAFAARQVAWLHQHGSLVGRYLGNEALQRAQAARDMVQSCIDDGDPDAGFDAYGDAWSLLNRLYREAQVAMREVERKKREKQRLAALDILSDCEDVWQSVENQAVLRRWADRLELGRLASELRDAGRGSPQQIQEKAKVWFDRFDKAMEAASQRARENAKAVQARIPSLHAALRSLGNLNADLLSKEEKGGLAAEKVRAQEDAEKALLAEDIEAVEASTSILKDLTLRYEGKIKAAQLEKAREVWQAALAGCGYSVTLRHDSDGTIILQASSFPTRSAKVQLAPGTDEARLDVGDDHGTHCVKDVQALQTELARRGMQVTVTDWGRGKPVTAQRPVDRTITAGGER